MSDFSNYIPQKSQFDAINLALAAISSKLGDEVPLSDPQYIKSICDSGLADKVFNAGDQISVPRATAVSASFKNLTGTAGITAASVTEATFFRVIPTAKSDHEFIFDGAVWKYEGSIVNPSTYGITYSGTPKADDVIVIHETITELIFDVAHVTKYGMALLLHNIFDNYQFDAPEALMVFTSGLTAGNYCVQLYKGAYGAGTAEDGYYTFTTTQAIPTNGFLRHTNMGSWASSYSPSRVQSGQFITYNASYSQIESISSIGYSSTAPSGYTLLGKTSANTKSDMASGTVDVAYINWDTHNAYGKGHYGESAARQLLNSDKPKNTFWAKQNNFDFPPSWASSANGFRYGLDKAFDSIVSTTNVVCGLNPSLGSGTYVCTDKYFLASRIEMGYGIEGGWQEGTAWDLFNGVDNSKRIKYRNGSAYYWWLRSPYPYAGYSNNERSVITDGSLNNNGAYNSIGLVPACIVGTIS